MTATTIKVKRGHVTYELPCTGTALRPFAIYKEGDTIHLKTVADLDGALGQPDLVKIDGGSVEQSIPAEAIAPPEEAAEPKPAAKKAKK